MGDGPAVYLRNKLRYGEFLYRDYPVDADHVAQAAETWSFEQFRLTD